MGGGGGPMGGGGGGGMGGMGAGGPFHAGGGPSSGGPSGMSGMGGPGGMGGMGGGPGGPSSGHTMFNPSHCLQREVICPQWCVMEDEFGCRSCPCGPGESETIIQKCIMYNLPFSSA